MKSPQFGRIFPMRNSQVFWDIETILSVVAYRLLQVSRLDITDVYVMNQAFNELRSGPYSGEQSMLLLKMLSNLAKGSLTGVNLKQLDPELRRAAEMLEESEMSSPFPPLSLLRILTLCYLERIGDGVDGKPKFSLVSLPGDADLKRLHDRDASSEDPAAALQIERRVLKAFLDRLYDKNLGMQLDRAQAFGWHSAEFDQIVLHKRALALGVVAPEFYKQETPPYAHPNPFDADNFWFVDLMRIEKGTRYGRGSTKLNAACRLICWPGKIGTAGDDVLEMWLAGQVEAVRDYNDFDALTTYGPWLRWAMVSGALERDFIVEEELPVFREFLEQQAKTRKHLVRWLEEWDRMGGIDAWKEGGYELAVAKSLTPTKPKRSKKKSAKKTTKKTASRTAKKKRTSRPK